MAGMSDNESDAKCLVHLQNALKEMILALNMEPDSWTIACAIQNVQGAIDDMRWDIKMDQNNPDRQDDKMETPAITEAAMRTLQEVAAATKKPYGNVTYADPKNGKYPIDTEEHIRAAWSYINMPKNASKYPMNGVTLESVKSKIKSAAKKQGIKIESSAVQSFFRSF